MDFNILMFFLKRTELRVLGTGDPKYIAGALAARVSFIKKFLE